MTEIRALGYVGVHAKSVDDWGAYGAGFLGLQLADRGRSPFDFLRMRLSLARAGVRHPVQVLPRNHVVSPSKEQG